ncbi:hypothetical protein QYM36_009165 [Artemia franciscana]|uniref:Uncharacterized protein n=1 Tax=Artemia franciscana TaxID=6661 RepID=A0AA88HTG6_ARTSF|nr:hypothetical protein QYM36_009165 [Artemia franciscana]
MVREANSQEIRWEEVVWNDLNGNGNYRDAFKSHRGSQFIGGRSDSALYFPSQDNYDGGVEGQRGQNSNRPQQQNVRGRGQMRDCQELFTGLVVLFTPAKEESSLYPYALEYSGNRFLITYFDNSGDVREISRREDLGYFQEIDENSVGQAYNYDGRFEGQRGQNSNRSKFLGQAFPHFWKEGNAILAVYTSSENTSNIEEQIGKLKLDHLDQTLREKLRRLLEMCGRMFAQSTYDVGKSTLWKQKLTLPQSYQYPK